MSIMEKFTSMFVRPNQQPGPTDDQPWYFKYGVKALSIVGAFFCILFGLINSLSVLLLEVNCLIGGILQVVVGFLVLAMEAPMCFFCIEYVNKISEVLEAKPIWYKAALYCGASFIPVVLCFGLGSLFPCALIFGAGVLYGMMALGKKASSEEMRQAAINSGLASGQITNDRAGIINNAQPFSFTGAVGTDSNV